MQAQDRWDHRSDRGWDRRADRDSDRFDVERRDRDRYDRDRDRYDRERDRDRGFSGSSRSDDRFASGRSSAISESDAIGKLRVSGYSDVRLRRDGDTWRGDAMKSGKHYQVWVPPNGQISEREAQ